MTCFVFCIMVFSLVLIICGVGFAMSSTFQQWSAPARVHRWSLFQKFISPSASVRRRPSTRQGRNGPPSSAPGRAPVIAER